jgi:NAD(P)H-hydrate epimerase
VTVTFSLPKPGLYLQPGCVCCGQVRVCDIGIPRELLLSLESRVATVDAGSISLPRRAPDAHKGDFGRDLILAGSVGFTGAPVLAANAASRAGAGLVYLGVPEESYAITAVKCSEVMPFPLPGDGGHVSAAAFDTLGEKLERCSVVLAGPGLGRSEACGMLIDRLVTESKAPLIWMRTA